MGKAKEIDLKKLTPGAVHYLLFGQIIVDLARNHRPANEYGDFAVIDQSMATHGFMENVKVSVYAATPEESAHELEVRKATITELEAKAIKDDEASRLLSVLLKLWKTEKGHWYEPIAQANMCFRRLSRYPYAMAIRVRMKDENRQGDELIPQDIPVVVKVYDDEFARRFDQILENGMAKEGNQELSFVAKCKACRPLMDDPRTKEATLVAALGGARGTGQKVYNCLVTDMRCPEARLLERGALDPENPEYVKLESVTYAKWQTLTKDHKRPTVEEVNALLKEVKAGNVNAKKVMDKGTVESFVANTSKSPRLRAALKNWLDNKPEDLVMADALYAGIDTKLVRLEAAGMIKEAEAALDAVIAKISAPAAPALQLPRLK